MRCPRILSLAVRPLYRVRGVIVSRSFTGRVTRPEKAIRWACERAIDAVEMWEMRPAFERLEEMARTADDVQARLEALCAEFGIDPTDSPSTESKP